MNIFYIVLSIDIIGIIIGLVSIWTIQSTRKQLGGAVGQGLNLVIWAVVFNILAFLWTILFMRLKLYPPPIPIDVHHALMTIGMVLFVLSAKKFSKTVNL